MAIAKSYKWGLVISRKEMTGKIASISGPPYFVMELQGRHLTIPTRLAGLRAGTEYIRMPRGGRIEILL